MNVMYLGMSFTVSNDSVTVVPPPAAGSNR